MTAGELIAAADSLRPNQYSASQKLEWLHRLDGQIRRELLATHEAEAEAPAEAAYTEQTELLVGFPYDSELYTAYLFCQIDLHNGEISRYQQSLALLSAAWRQLADSINRGRPPKGAAAWKL